MKLRITVLLEGILIVIDVLTYPVPAYTLDILNLAGIAKNLHTIVVEGVWLCQVDDIKSNFQPLLGIADSIEKPLCMSICIYIVL